VGLITKEVIMKWHFSSKKWYIDKGFAFTKLGEEFKVKVEDLTHASSAIVDVQCDGCKEYLKPMKWLNYKKYVKEDGRYYCHKCSQTGHKNYISFYEWCYTHLSKELADWILSRWDYSLNIDENGNIISPKYVSYGSVGFNNKGYWFKCLDHPEHKSELKSIARFTYTTIKKGSTISLDCIMCNTISVTHQELIKFLVNKEDAYKYSVGSNKKIPMKCPDCGHEKQKSLDKLWKKGFGCECCGDGISFPEKFLFNVFEQLLGNDFNTQLSEKTFKWCDNYKYDFYINKIDEIICECQGIQHYEETNSTWRMRLNEVQENDKVKEQLARNNNINNYIVLDCRYSNMNWIKNSIMKSDLPKLLNFSESDIDWLKCYEYACKSIVKTICNMWNDIKNTLKISSIIKKCRSTVIKYLKQGTELGWCDYDPKEETRKSGYKSKRVFSKIICTTTGEIFNSQTEAGLKYNIFHSGISLCCRNKAKYCGLHPETGVPLGWKYYDNLLES